jgi:hypothetical protein
VRSERQAAAFLKGLSETGYLEGQNMAVEYHWLNGQYDQLPITYGLTSSAAAWLLFPQQAAILPRLRPRPRQQQSRSAFDHSDRLRINIGRDRQR